MSQKQGKNEESAFNRLKHFLGISTSKAGPGHSSQLRQSSVQYVFTPELVKVKFCLFDKVHYDFEVC